MKKLSKRGKIILISIAGVILLAGIGVTAKVMIDKAKYTPTPKEKGKKEEKKVEEGVKGGNISFSSSSRPIAVMINNLNDARKVQSGLSEAYLVYEIIVEGGITRYLALFNDTNTEKIGSVRSSRHYFLDYVLENDAIYVHWGWSPQAEEDIKTLKINNINGLTHGAYFYRDNPLGLSTEHTGFTNMTLIRKGIEKLGYRTTSSDSKVLGYSNNTVDFSKDSTMKNANKIVINYSNYTKNSYEYDSENKVYKRFVNGAKQNDFATGKQLTVKNVIAYQIENYTIAGDNKNRQFLNNIGSGEGYYFTEGKAIKIKWSKKDRASKTIYTYLDGTELKINSGNTFIQIVPTSGNITME